MLRWEKSSTVRTEPAPGVLTAYQDFPLVLFLPGHPDMTYLVLLSTSLYFSKRGAY